MEVWTSHGPTGFIPGGNGGVEQVRAVSCDKNQDRNSGNGEIV